MNGLTGLHGVRFFFALERYVDGLTHYVKTPQATKSRQSGQIYDVLYDVRPFESVSNAALYGVLFLIYDVMEQI